MTDTIVLITGALSGIGRATALVYARQGATVVVSGRRDDAGKELVDQLRALGSLAEYVRVDVRSDDDVRDFVDRTVERFGRIDVAVNAAGTEGEPGPIVDQTTDKFNLVFETNVLGTLLSMKHELRVMQRQAGGSIVNISSTMGHRGATSASVYTASKHAVEGLTKCGALEGAPFNVRVNAIAPGPTDTDMLTRFTGTAERKAAFAAGVPLKRLGTPDEIAACIVFVASPQAAYVTGQVIDVNGGKTAT
jgi:NAD(P)-dependent dehydrogenase (short-subunit alcohol dehydrogenase family)